jgi:transglutaminase-like putative cysteine protease
MKVVRILACLIIGFAISISYASASIKLNKKDVQVDITKTPSWVHNIPVKYTESDLPKSPRHYLLYDRQYNLTNGYQKYYRRVYTLNDASAIESGADIKIQFDPFYEKLEIHQINVIRNRKTASKLTKQDIQIISSEDKKGKNIYSGTVTALVLMPDIRIGDTIDYSFTITGMNPVYQNKFSNFIKLGWQISLDHIHVSISTPKNIDLKINKVGVAEDIRWKEYEAKKELELDMYNSRIYENEGNLPDWFIPYPYLQVSQYSSWSDVSIWANSLFDDNEPHSESLTKYISELRAMDRTDAINHAINFVQNNIRYLSLNIAENSHKAHSVSEVFENRYGDCKDKSHLLSEILRAIGVNAYPALVDADNTIYMNHTIPGHDLFNHAIVMMQIGKQVTWIDPTMTYQGYDYQSKYHPDYGAALVVNHKHSEKLTQMNKPSQTSISIDEQLITADYSSPADWTISTVMVGREAEDFRYRLALDGKEKYEKRYLNYYAETYPEIKQASNIQIEDDIDLNQIKIREHYSVPGFWDQASKKEVDFNLDADYMSDYVKMPKTIKRSQPLSLDYPITIKHKVTMLLPEHLDWSSVVSTENFNDEYVSFKSKTSFDNKRFIFENRYESKNSFVSADKIPGHLELLKKIRSNLRFSGYISDIENYAGKEAMEDLLNSITDL